MIRNSFYLIALLGSLMTLSACNLDPCKDVNCGANGSCLYGTCVCDIGYEGSACQIEWAEKFVGSYLGKDVCGNTTYNLAKPAVVSKQSATQIRISNFGGFDSFIDAQVTKTDEISFTNFEDPAKRRFTGTGKISGNRLTGSYTVTFSDGSKENCTFDYTK